MSLYILADDGISADNSPWPLAGEGNPLQRVGEGSADLARRKQPLTPGFAVHSPLGEGRYQRRIRYESKCRKSTTRLKPRPYKLACAHAQLLMSPCSARKKDLSPLPLGEGKDPISHPCPRGRVPLPMANELRLSNEWPLEEA